MVITQPNSQKTIMASNESGSSWKVCASNPLCVPRWSDLIEEVDRRDREIDAQQPEPEPQSQQRLESRREEPDHTFEMVAVADVVDSPGRRAEPATVDAHEHQA
jgi:hypothetical protein